LFLIGYGPTPSKRNDIVLEQEVERGFELLLHRKEERTLLKEIFFLVCKVSWTSFPNGGIQGNCNFLK
jgi:hypothetical protein